MLDLTVVWAGPYATMALGDLGAEIIRLDNHHVFPSSTKGLARVAPALVEAGGPNTALYPGRDPEPRAYNRTAFFNCHSRNKRMATLDLRSESGREIFLRLVDRSDVLVENNAARTLDALGVGWDVLHERNPRFICVRMPPLGLGGPYSGYIGFGAHFEAISGVTSLRGYADTDPSTTTPTFHMDPASGAVAAFAVMMALRRRSKTGVGEFVEVPQAENLIQQIGEYVVDDVRSGADSAALGNRHAWRAPQGCYRCAGDDRWAVISVGTDREWDGLRRAMGDPAWARDERFATLAGRRAAHDDIDKGIESWTADLDPHEVFRRCQAQGVPSGPVMHEADLFSDPHLRARGFFRELTSDETGTHDYPGHLWRWTGPPMRWDWGPHGMGADNEYVYKEVLGMSDDEYERASVEGHISLDYVDADGNPL